MKELEPDDDSDGSDSDDGIDELVGKALAKMEASKFPLKAFSKFNSRFLECGKVEPVNLSSSRGIVIQQSAPKDERKKSSSGIYDHRSLTTAPINPPKVSTASPGLGKGWFNLEPLPMDEKLKRDIKIIQMRNYLDPKRFYKNPDKIKHVLHVGTVIEGPTEFKSSRINRKDRQASIVDEILADKAVSNYSKRTYQQIQDEHSNKRKFHKDKKGKKKIRKLY